MADGYVFIGGVDVSEACLRALCEDGHVPELAVGYAATWTGASGFRDLGPLAGEFGFELVRTAAVNDADLVARVREIAPSVVFVIGWSQLVKADLLACPRYGCVGIHPTDLPTGRGRAPIPWTIIKGLTETASTMFFLTEGVDDGDIIDKVRISVDPRETATSLYAKHREAHVRLVRRHAEALLAGTAPRVRQSHEHATYWPGRRPEDGRIDPTAGVSELERLVRAVTHPFPGAFVETDTGGLTVWSADVVPTPAGHPVGALVDSPRGKVLRCRDGGLLLLDTEPRA